MSDLIDLSGDVEHLRELYQTMKIKEMALEFSVAYVTMQRELSRLGVSDGRKHRFNPVLTETERELVIGSLLGDGCVYPNGRHCYFAMGHGPKQKDYLYWKHEVLARLMRPGCPYSKTDKSGYLAYFSNSLTLPAFDEFRAAFYSGKKKILPATLDFLSPFSLAIWYQDDGSTSKEGIKIASMSFTEQENCRLAELIALHGIQCVVSPDEDYRYLRFHVQESRKFLDLTRPFAHPSLSYKFVLK